MKTRSEVYYLAAIVTAALVSATPLTAQTVFTFEGTDPLASPLISGDTNFWQVTDERGAGGSTYSLRAYDPVIKPVDGEANYAQDPFESFTYDLPIDLEAGTISVDFYDTFGAAPPGPPNHEWAFSIVLEDADNPADFVALEIAKMNYGPFGGGYYPSEGIDNGGDSQFDTYAAGPSRSIGWHTVHFDVTTTGSTLRVDGAPTAPEVQGPGGSKNLRLRFMADSASAGGSSNWTTPGAPSYPGKPAEVFIDNLVFSATAPAVASQSFGFESGEVDSPGEFMGPTAFDNPLMAAFVNDFASTTTQASAGTRSATFVNGVEPYKSLVFDLASAAAGNATLSFYDARGAAYSGTGHGVAAFGASILIESGSNPADFVALEIWDAPYPGDDSAPNNYYAVRSNAGGGASTYSSNYYGARSVGWQDVTIVLSATESRILVNGQENLGGTGLMVGPGLNASPKLRIMSGSASNGGYGNWTNTGELDTSYTATREPYLNFDSITLPITSTSVADWQLFQ